MLGSLMRISGDAKAVAFVRLGPSSPATVAGRPWVKLSSEILENLHGLKSSSGPIGILLPEMAAARFGKPGREVVVFLQPEGADYRLVKRSEPLDVPVDGRETFLRCVRETVTASQPSAGASARRQHVLKMLQSDIPFFREDASRSALETTGFTNAEIETLIGLVKGTPERPPVEGATRENLLATIFKVAPSGLAIPFGKEMLLAGSYREVYLGLSERELVQAEPVVKAFLDDPNEKIQAQGLLVAGLMRRTDLLDAFEKRFPPQKLPSDLRSAIAKARELAAREL